MDLKEKNGRAYEKVLDYLKTQILSGNLERGQKLPPERELALTLGVGRNSVREALRTLGHMGFICSEHGAGNFVSCDFKRNLQESLQLLIMLDEVDLRQISELRQGVEVEAALLACGRAAPAQLDRLELIVVEMRDSMNEQRNALLDKELHNIIAEASGNQLMIQILQALSSSIDGLIVNMRRRIVVNPENRERLQKAHEGIVQGLRNANNAQILHSMRTHYQIIRENLVEI